MSKGLRDILRNEIDEKFKEDSMIGIIKSLIALFVIIVFALMGYFPNKIDAFVNSVNPFILVLVSISNLVEGNRVGRVVFYSVAVLSALFCIYMIVKLIKNFNRKISVVAFFSLGKTQFILDKELSKKHEVESYKLDLSKEMYSVKDYGEIGEIISIQDREIEKFKDEKLNDASIFGFAGIGHTPLIFRAGYKVGDETYFYLFHKHRNEDEFKYLNNVDDVSQYESLKVSKQIVSGDSDELIVILETTYEVKNYELSLLNPDNKNIIRFSLRNKGVDVINNRTQIDEYVNIINSEVRKLVKEDRIKLVHMVLSTSVAMTFALGMSMSNHHNVDTIVYHYQNCYPWGIDIFKEPKECIVITKANSGSTSNLVKT